MATPPKKLYHYTDEALADSILEHGIDWRKAPDGRVITDHDDPRQPPGNYLVERADEWEDGIYFEVDPTGLNVLEDPFHDPGSGFWYSPDPIPARNLRRHASMPWSGDLIRGVNMVNQQRARDRGREEGEQNEWWQERQKFMDTSPTTYEEWFNYTYQGMPHAADPDDITTWTNPYDNWVDPNAEDPDDPNALSEGDKAQNAIMDLQFQEPKTKLVDRANDLTRALRSMPYPNIPPNVLVAIYQAWPGLARGRDEFTMEAMDAQAEAEEMLRRAGLTELDIATVRNAINKEDEASAKWKAQREIEKAWDEAKLENVMREQRKWDAERNREYDHEDALYEDDDRTLMDEIWRSQHPGRKPVRGLDDLHLGAWRMQRLGATPAELATETIEELMGYRGKRGTGHKPPRADIAKIKQAHSLYWLAQGYTPEADDPALERELLGTLSPDDEALLDWTLGDGSISPEQAERRGQLLKELTYKAALAWEERIPNESDRPIIDTYLHLVGSGMEPSKAFDQLTYAMSTSNGREVGGIMGVETEEEAKKVVGQALKKYEFANWPALYTGIKDSLDDLYRRSTEGYKLWPWAVKAMKEQFQDRLQYSTSYRALKPNDLRFPHLVDVVSEAGPLLAELKRQNKTPQGLDVNKMAFKDLEDWLMEWKRDNRDAESKGEVVYEWPDGWTIEKLTTPEQLQFEGDEMGHCVGGYHSQVEAGHSAIYSLRDPKGGPHATVEITPIPAGKALHDKPLKEIGEEEGRELGTKMRVDPSLYLMPHLDTPEDAEHYKRLRQEGRTDLIEQFYPDYAHERTHIYPGDDPEGLYTWNGSHGEPAKDLTFEVVQVQGKEDRKPKPEYNDRVKEWIRHLREDKGVDFVRSEDWYGNYDDVDGVDNALAYPEFRSAADLDDWYNDYDEKVHEAYMGTGEDDWGIRHKGTAIDDLDLEGIMTECLASLVNDYNRDIWQTSDWTALGRATYQAAVLGRFSKEQFDKAREKSEEMLQEWVNDAAEYIDIPEGAVQEKFEEMAAEQGVNIDDAYDPVDDEFREDLALNNHEDLWYDARDAIIGDHETEYAGNAWKYLQYLYDLSETNVEEEGWPGYHDSHRDLPLPGQLPAPGAFEKARREQTGIGIPGALSHTAGMTLPQQQRQWAELSPRLETVEELPGGWKVARPTDFESINAIGRQMRNCWQSTRGVAGDPEGAAEQIGWHRVLLDPNGLPQLAYYHGGDSSLPDIHSAYGPRNEYPSQEAARALVQHAANGGHTIQQMLQDSADGREWLRPGGGPIEPRLRATLGEPVDIGARRVPGTGVDALPNVARNPAAVSANLPPKPGAVYDWMRDPAAVAEVPAGWQRGAPLERTAAPRFEGEVGESPEVVVSEWPEERPDRHNHTPGRRAGIWSANDNAVYVGSPNSMHSDLHEEFIDRDDFDWAKARLHFELAPRSGDGSYWVNVYGTPSESLRQQAERRIADLLRGTFDAHPARSEPRPWALATDPDPAPEAQRTPSMHPGTGA